MLWKTQALLITEIMCQNTVLYSKEHFIANTWKGYVLFKNALSIFYLRLYGIRYMVKDHSDSERGNLPPHGLLFPISSKGSFIYIIPQTG